MTRLTPEFESILNKYRKHKLDTYKVLELLSDDYTFNDFGADTEGKRFKALLECGTFLQFNKSVEEGKKVYHLVGGNFCRQRVCPMCQFRKSEKMFAQVLRVVKHLEGEYRFIHLVLTIPNADNGRELVQGIKVLYKGFNTFFKYKDIERAYKGALRCLEVSYNYDDKTFHPHLHCLICVRSSYFNDSKVYLKYDRVRELWSRAARRAALSLGYSKINDDTPLLQINLRACKAGDYEGVAEVSKYCLKPLEMDEKEHSDDNKRMLLTLFHTLKGMRFVQKYGVIKEAFKLLYGDSEDEDTDEGSSEVKGSKGFFWSPDIMNYWGE